MTVHKTMNTVIHAAFRRDLARFEDAFAWAPTGQKAAALVGAWDNFCFQLHHHHQDEETIFWPALRALGVDESTAGQLEQEHARMRKALDTADAAVDAFGAQPSLTAAGGARVAISELGAVLAEHLAHEERDMEPVSATHHASPQIKSAQKQVRRAHRGNQGTFMAWLLDGADDDAIRGLRQEIPRPALFVISRIGGRHYRRTVMPVWA